jgi:hypothetical protein
LEFVVKKSRALAVATVDFDTTVALLTEAVPVIAAGAVNTIVVAVTPVTRTSPFGAGVAPVRPLTATISPTLKGFVDTVRVTVVPEYAQLLTETPVVVIEFGVSKLSEKRECHRISSGALTLVTREGRAYVSKLHSAGARESLNACCALRRLFVMSDISFTVTWLEFVA